MGWFSKKPRITHYSQLFTEGIFETPIDSFKIMSQKNHKNDDGEEYITYTIELPDWEFELFNFLKIVDRVDNPGRNYIFFQPVFRTQMIHNIEVLVNYLYQLYGADDQGIGKFNRNDDSELRIGEIWQGRCYLDLDTPIMLDFDDSDDNDSPEKLSLVFFTKN